MAKQKTSSKAEKTEPTSRTLNEHFRTQAKAHGFSDALISRFSFMEPEEPYGFSESFKEMVAAGVIRQVYAAAKVSVPEVDAEEM